ncbi:MAG: 1-acyl-sn-glycerol-3-phosphate acyltransferase [Intrasporangium sp.]|uniref:lysophospholipid acyltransferase family protein n=1 Tax=Intrasporangium sp. TaxID=1925024 RepID=UPI003F7F6912
MNEPDKTTGRRPRSEGAFAAGAARASGERRRRAGTPLIPTDPVEVSTARRVAATSAPDDTPDETQPSSTPREPVTPAKASGEGKRPRRAAMKRSAGTTRPGPAPAGGRGDADPGARRVGATGERADRARLRSVPPPSDDPAPGGDEERRLRESARALSARAVASAAAQASGTAEKLVARFLDAADTSSDIRPSVPELVSLAVDVLRAAATSSGVPAADVERQVAETLAYVRRRLMGDVSVDEFGFDEDFTRHVYLPLLRPLYKKWFRVEVKGIEHIPATGGALVVANHSGTVALDSLMTQVAVHDEHPQHRHLRMLGADLVFQTPFIGAMARRSGSTLAATTDAERLLGKGELVGVWPEGFKGVGKPFSERYKLQRFGRGGFVAAALRAEVPIVPCSIVGAEEIYPMLGNMPTVARLLGVPYAPITPTFPWLGLLGLVPLPSKWLIEFGPPVDTSALGPEAADDPMIVFDLTDQVRETIQQTLYSLLMQRTSVFI